MTVERARPTKLGMLLVGHGTRDQRGVAEFFETAAMVAPLVPDVAVEPSFLELAEPSIGKALEQLVERDVRKIIVVPLLLFAAGHAKQDIPSEVARAAARFPRVLIRPAEPLGCHEKILAASAERFHGVLPSGVLPSGVLPSGVLPSGALPPGEFDPATDVALVMVSRGTSDSAAIEDVRRFVRLRREVTPVASASIGFMAVAEPSVATELHTLAHSASACVVVQPHLLFHGRLTSEVRALVQSKQAECPAKRWLVADHLGPCELVAEAAVSRFWEAARASIEWRD